MKTMKLWRIAFMMLAAFSLASCSDNDASDTLYTLIKRVKPIIEEHSNLKIESDRVKSYTLELK